MKLFSALAIATLLSTANAQAEQTRTLHGLFCNTEAQARDVLQHMKSTRSLHAAVATINATAVNCVVADRLQYVVEKPLMIDTIRQNGFTFTIYGANLIGIQVGGNVRPVAPPVQTYFVLDRRLGGVAMLSST